MTMLSIPETSTTSGFSFTAGTVLTENNAALNKAALSSLPRHKAPDEAVEEDDEAQQLPISPDEGTPVIPDDDERVLDVPS
jgi:hypothetical protein